MSDHAGVRRREARAVATRRLAELRLEPYWSLRDRWLGKLDCEEIAADSGKVHQVEIEAFWDDPQRPDGNLRVMVSVGSSFFPPTVDFIKAPDGSVVGGEGSSDPTAAPRHSA